MYTLTYESIAVKRMGSGEMDELLAKARKFNNSQGITGCLVYYMGGFVQVLEGDKQAVENLYEKIKVDKRHKNVNMFSSDEIKSRTFPNWGMAYYPIDESKTSEVEYEQFKRNLLLLADLVEPTNITAKMFWKRIKLLISKPPLKG